jgi:hypothetical protein
MTYLEELRDVIRRLHGAEATHVESVAVKETFKGQTVWEGSVEIFDLVGHPTASRAYAWAHDGKHPKESSVAVLHVEPITSAAAAVRAAIVQEFRSLEPAE